MKSIITGWSVNGKAGNADRVGRISKMTVTTHLISLVLALLVAIQPMQALSIERAVDDAALLHWQNHQSDLDSSHSHTGVDLQAHEHGTFDADSFHQQNCHTGHSLFITPSYIAPTSAPIAEIGIPRVERLSSLKLTLDPPPPKA